jgi:hypothetical protein
MVILLIQFNVQYYGRSLLSLQKKVGRKEGTQQSDQQKPKSGLADCEEDDASPAAGQGQQCRCSSVASSSVGLSIGEQQGHEEEEENDEEHQQREQNAGQPLAHSLQMAPMNMQPPIGETDIEPTLLGLSFVK